MNRWVGGLLLLGLVSGCAKEKAKSDNVVMVKEDDARMNAAIAKARATVQTFIAALQSPKPDQSGFSIKVGFEDGAQVEHMWLTDVTFDGTRFHGVVNNDPDLVKNVKLGDKTTVDPAKISDWMYLEKDKLLGGETIRAMRDALSPAERVEFDKGIPFKLD